MIWISNTGKHREGHNNLLSGLIEVLERIVDTNTKEKIWTVLEEYYQLSLENMKAGVTTSEKYVRMALTYRKSDIIREAEWVTIN